MSYIKMSRLKFKSKNLMLHGPHHYVTEIVMILLNFIADNDIDYVDKLYNMYN